MNQDTHNPNRRFFSKRAKRSIALCSLVLPLFLAFALGGLGESASRIFLMVVGFSLIITVHELGHFVVARLCTVKCEVFSLGIGPRMLGWKKGVGFSFGNEPESLSASSHSAKTPGEIEDEKYARRPAAELTHAAVTGDLQQTSTNVVGETDYRVSWLPLGGYVRMLGQDDMDPTATSTDPRAFNNRPIWQRMCIVSAGVIMNVIFALVVFALVFRHGVDFPPARVGQLVYDSPAEKQGLQMGDSIVSIDGVRPSEGFLEYTDLVVASALGSPGREIRLTINRNGQTLEKRVIPVKGPEGRLQIGVPPLPSLNLAVLDAESRDALQKRQPELTKQLLKVRPGDYVSAVDGTPVNDYPAFYQLLQASNGKAAAFQIRNKDASLPPEDMVFKPELEPRLGVKDFSALLGLCPRVRITEPIAGGPAANAGILAGDVILRIEATENPTAADFLAAVEKNAGHAISITVLRGTETKTFTVTPEANKDGNGRISAAYALDFASPIVAAPADPSGPFAKVMRGSKIVSVNGETVATWDDVVRVARANPQNPLVFAFEDSQGQNVSAELKPGDERQRDLERVEYGVAAAIGGLPFEPVMLTQKSESILGAVRMGLDHTKSFILQFYSTLRGLFGGSVPITELHSVVGIAKVGYDVQEKGFIYLLFILAVVSVNLAVANFLPLPIVDGGLFILLVIEKLRGKPLPARVLGAINMAGLCLLAGLFLFVTINNDLGLFFGK